MTLSNTPNIFLPLSTYPDPVEESCFESAIAVARHIGASITGGGIEVDIPPVKNKLAEAILHIQDQIRAVEQASRAQAERLLQDLARLGESSGVTISCESVRAQPALLDDAIVQQARFHDLVVWPVSQNRATAQALIFGSGRPVLLLAAQDRQAPMLDTVVVATDFGRVATRAMFDAQPFLKCAKKINVVTVTDEKDLRHGNRTALTAYFKRQGLVAEIIQLEARGASVGDILQNYIEQIGGGLLVMGAFGHSRLRDFILGGATQSVLGRQRYPVLMSY